MVSKTPGPDQFRVDALRQNAPTRFTLEPDSAARTAIARRVGADAVRKLRLSGQIEPAGRDGWRLEAVLGATVTQPCIVTLEPVSTRIDAPVERRFVPPGNLAAAAGSEVEMDEDDTLEPLGEVIDLAQILEEALTLALPVYPRKDGATLEQAQFAGQGTVPMTDEDAKPFAGLAALRDTLDGEKD